MLAFTNVLLIVSVCFGDKGHGGGMPRHRHLGVGFKAPASLPFSQTFVSFMKRAVAGSDGPNGCPVQPGPAVSGVQGRGPRSRQHPGGILPSEPRAPRGRAASGKKIVDCGQCCSSLMCTWYRLHPWGKNYLFF